MTGAAEPPSQQPFSTQDERTPRPRVKPADAATVPFPVLGAPTVVHVSKLSSDAISRCNLGEVEYVVIEPAPDGMRLRPAGIEDQVQHEQEGGLGHVTYSLGEFLDEFTNAPSNPAPTFERLAQFKRDYAKLSPPHRQMFRAAVKKFVAPLSTTPPGDPGRHSCKNSLITRASSRCVSAQAHRRSTPSGKRSDTANLMSYGVGSVPMTFSTTPRRFVTQPIGPRHAARTAATMSQLST